MKKIFKYIGLILICIPYIYHFPIFSNGKINYIELLLYIGYLIGLILFVMAVSDKDDW